MNEDKFAPARVVPGDYAETRQPIFSDKAQKIYVSVVTRFSDADTELLLRIEVKDNATRQIFEPLGLRVAEFPLGRLSHAALITDATTNAKGDEE